LGLFSFRVAARILCQRPVTSWLLFIHAKRLLIRWEQYCRTTSPPPNMPKSCWLVSGRRAAGTPCDHHRQQASEIAADGLTSSPPLPAASRRFPPPWSVEEHGACFIVRDRTYQTLAYVYYEEEPGRRANLLTGVCRRRTNASPWIIHLFIGVLRALHHRFVSLVSRFLIRLLAGLLGLLAGRFGKLLRIRRPGQQC
jgi:hypothetical protein